MLLNIDEEALAKKIQDLIFNEIAGCLPKRAEIRLNLQPVIAEAVISSREYFHVGDNLRIGSTYVKHNRVFCRCSTDADFYMGDAVVDSYKGHTQGY